MSRVPSLVLLLVCLVPSGAFAQTSPLGALSAVHDACASIGQSRHADLYTVDVDPGWRFESAEEGTLYVDTRRNLTALDGQVSILVSGFDPIGFEADGEQVGRLRDLQEAGARLRLGFFLGFDNPTRQPCLVRNEHAVTIVRADLATAELVSSTGEVITRAETDRLAAWQDDHDALTIPGEGPRGAVGQARFADGQSPPDTWQRALAAQGVRNRFGRCHGEGVQRGAAAEGQVVVRLNIETRTGRIRRADVALSSLGDTDEAECIARSLGGHVSLPAGPSSWQAEVVDLSVPVRLAAD